ncbi:cilia- and flagella-associated protein 65-like [Amphiura filiformis]|uniref:cilia- and flagella-associated protein 65-like n=1 Tax=Amphiura filiformis TaxID=82378 RepID=UPI003B20BF73
MPVAVAHRPRVNGSKTNHYGIEVAKGLTWKGWEPGGEYTKHVILKNVKVKTQKLKYSNPNTRFFTTLYPEPIVLSAGTSFSLPVTFRPLERNKYEDCIEFETMDGKFEVPIQAVLPQHNLSLPEHLNFGMCASHDHVQVTFELNNTSELTTKFVWLFDEPFTLEPSEGTLPPKSKCTILATFKPTAAVVYETVIECCYGNDLSHKKNLQLEGIGKLPHLLVSAPGKNPKALQNVNIESVISFGDVAIGTTIEKIVELHNLAPVNVPFTISHPTRDTRIDTVFECLETHGVAPPSSVYKIPVIFSPHTVGEESADYLHVQAIGNMSKTVVKLVGKCKGPQVSLASEVLDFGRIHPGDSSTRSLDIINESDVPAAFQFMIDGVESVFHFSIECGSIQPHTTQTIIIQFAPSHPINYYRRVTCLVQNQYPLFVDLIGTLHTELNKPAVLQPKHLNQYRTNMARGFSVFPPEQLNEMVKTGKLQRDPDGYLMHPPSEMLEELLPPAVSLEPMSEYFNDGHHGDIMTPAHVSIDVCQVDFDQCDHQGFIEQKTLNITNHTKGKITIVWMGNDSHVFSVTPTTCDIPPLKMSSFRVTFKPGGPNRFFGSELEGYAFYKSMRDYRLVQDETFCPPWCLTVSATGHTFQPGHETFLPSYTLDVNKVVFPACDVGDSLYKTVLVTNTGTTPIHYTLEDDPNGIFKVKPTHGLIRDKYQLLIFKMTPKEKKTLRHQFQCRLNENDKHLQVIEMLGSSEQPKILMDAEGVLYFKPTCVGTSSRRGYKIRNTSRIPLHFEWRIHYADSKYIKVEPMKGTILPNESQSHLWTFTPVDDRKYVLKPHMNVDDIRHIGEVARRQQFSLRAAGEGSAGELKADESFIDLSDVVVNTAIHKDIVVVNNSNCSLHYTLHVDQLLEGSYAEEAMTVDRLALELDITQDILPARSRRIIRATVRPVRRLTYNFRIAYQLLTPDSGGNHPLSEGHYPLCEMTANGVYPVVQVTDARCYGSASGISKARLWGLFSLDGLNTSLDCDPSIEELTYPKPTRHSTTRKAPVNTRTVMDFNFSAAPAGCEPCVVHLMLKNTGSVATEWSFLFPEDLHLELEYWAETGEFDGDELHEMRIMDNKLFTVEPKQGWLAPGHCQTLTLSYSHDFSGTDRLPVLFKLSQGREILLNFVGVTVDADHKYVHFPSSKHMFSPVPVGLETDPKQIYELYNGGAVPVQYQLDLTALQYVQEENFNHKIFECLNPTGEIAPGTTANVEWVFSPLESKTYMVNVPIHIIGGDTALITFTGIGYDKRVMGDTVQMNSQLQPSTVPSVQSVPIPGQLVYLSEERVSFGNMPLFSQSRRMIYVTNHSPNHTVSFEWYVTSAADSQMVEIEPVSAVLEPGESCMCKVSFTATGEPSFYDLDVICEVTDETIMANYRRDLAAWEAEKTRQQYEFTINDPNAPKPNVRLCRQIAQENGRQSPVSEEFKRYQTLPPIKHMETEKEQKDRQYRERHTDTGTPLWEKPEVPESFLLHLGITARTHTIAEYQSNFPNAVQKYFIDRSMSERSLSSSLGKPAASKKLPDTLTEEEEDLVTGIAANIIRALLDDHDFHEALREIPHEPVPYFTQFGEKPQTLSQMGMKIMDIEKTGSPLPPLPAPEKDMPDVRTHTRATVAEVSFDVNSLTGSRRQSVKSEGHMPAESPVSKHIIAESIASLELPARSLAQSSLALHTEEDYQQSLREERKRIEQQTLKRLSEFGNVLESVLENTIFNIVNESGQGEVNLTARPRIIALPPSTPPNQSTRRGSSGSEAAPSRLTRTKVGSIKANNSMRSRSPAGSVRSGGGESHHSSAR